jgi:hypothetical protein
LLNLPFLDLPALREEEHPIGMGGVSAASRLENPSAGRSHHFRTHPKRDSGFGEALVQGAERRPQF